MPFSSTNNLFAGDLVLMKYKVTGKLNIPPVLEYPEI